MSREKSSTPARRVGGCSINLDKDIGAFKVYAVERRGPRAIADEVIGDMDVGMVQGEGFKPGKDISPNIVIGM